MYNDEQNLYHYTYPRGGQERIAPPQSTAPIQELKPSKKKKKHLGLKIASLALCCTLLGGVAGGGAAWFLLGRGGAPSAGPSGGAAAQPPAVTAPTGGSGDKTAAALPVRDTDGTAPLTDAEVYAANVDSVVAISTSGTATVGSGFWQTQQPTAGAGSGFILTPDGFIATNYHVIDGADSVQVTLYNGEVYDAQVVGGDEDYDIAVIKVDGKDLQAVTMGDSTALRVGDRVLAIGNPLGELTFSMSGGMVSSVNRAIDVDGIPFNMIQTDASINPGNSGGPMFDRYGRVVGIVSAKYTQASSGASAEGLGFAIPINDVAAMIQDVIANGYVTNKPYLGITGMSMSQQLASQFRYDITKGVFVSAVDQGGAAERAGLRMGDVIVKIDDRQIDSMADLTIAKKQYRAGDTCTLTVWRQGKTETASLTWDAAPEPEQPASQETAPETGNGDNGGSGSNGGYDPYDLFEYFFGNRFW